MRERGIRETPCDRTTDRSWSDVGQLAQTGTAKHRAVGMATEEHFPPNSALRRQRVKERERSVLLLQPFLDTL